MNCYRTRREIQALFDQLGLTYLARTRIDWEPLLSRRLKESPYYRRNQAVFARLSRRYGTDIDQGRIAPIYIKKIDDAIGYGVFANAPIAAGDFIGEYAGVVQISGKYTHCFSADKGYESDYSWYYLDELDLAPPLEINGRQEGNEMRFVNHGPDPNLVVEHTLHRGQWVLFFAAGRDIAQGEELRISYGEEYWEEGYRADWLS